MSNIKYDFKNKVVLVTGGSSGIGRETAIKFAENGAKVVVSDINDDLGLQTVNLIKNFGGDAHYIKCDVSRSDEVEKLLIDTIKQYKKLNIVCNDAGIEGKSGDTTQVTVENWDNVINTNLKGVWLCMKYQIPELLKENGGSIVNVSSIAGLVGFPGLPAYVASKHGVVGLTKTAALEFADKNIRINAVCPGPIMTPMLERLISINPGMKDQLVAGVPEKRIGTPADVADTILFLCSDQASYINGQSLAIDGGWIAQ